jgi:hypothetical protein
MNLANKFAATIAKSAYADSQPADEGRLRNCWCSFNCQNRAHFVKPNLANKFAATAAKSAFAH